MSLAFGAWVLLFVELGKAGSTEDPFELSAAFPLLQSNGYMYTFCIYLHVFYSSLKAIGSLNVGEEYHFRYFQLREVFWAGQEGRGRRKVILFSQHKKRKSKLATKEEVQKFRQTVKAPTANVNEEVFGLMTYSVLLQCNVFNTVSAEDQA